MASLDLLARLKLKDEFTGPAKKAEKSMGALSGSASKLTGIIAGIGAGAALGAFAKDVVQTGIAFTDSMSQVSAVSGVVGTQLDSMKDLAMKMGAETVFSASEAADAMTYLSMA